MRKVPGPLWDARSPRLPLSQSGPLVRYVVCISFPTLDEPFQEPFHASSTEAPALQLCLTRMRILTQPTVSTVCFAPPPSTQVVSHKFFVFQTSSSTTLKSIMTNPPRSCGVWPQRRPMRVGINDWLRVVKGNAMGAQARSGEAFGTAGSRSNLSC